MTICLLWWYSLCVLNLLVLWLSEKVNADTQEKSYYKYEDRKEFWKKKKNPEEENKKVLRKKKGRAK